MFIIDEMKPEVMDVNDSYKTGLYLHSSQMKSEFFRKWKIDDVLITADVLYVIDETKPEVIDAIFNFRCWIWSIRRCRARFHWVTWNGAKWRPSFSILSSTWRSISITSSAILSPHNAILIQRTAMRSWRWVQLRLIGFGNKLSSHSQGKERKSWENKVVEPNSISTRIRFCNQMTCHSKR